MATSEQDKGKNAAPSAPAPASAGGGGTADYIGALISLVSRSDIRYQGFLAQINAEQATVALEKVRSWGTEGRLAQQGRANDEIPPNDNVYDYIVFRAADVKDLKIDDQHPDRSRPPPPPPPSNAFQDPAILGSSGPQFGGPFGPPPGAPYGMPPPPPGAFGPGGYGPGPGGFGPPRPPFPNQGMPPPPPHQQSPFQQQQFPHPPAQTDRRQQLPPQAPQQQQSQEQKKPAEERKPSQEPAPEAKLPPTGPRADQASKAPQDAPTQPAASSQAKTNDAKDADTVADHLSKLSVAGAANLPSAPSAKSPSASAPSSANLPPIPHAAAKAAAALSPQANERRARTVPGSGGRNRGPSSSVFDNARGAAVEVPDSDFDFAAANAKFDKTKGDVTSPGAGHDDAANGASAGINGSNGAGDVLDAIPPPVDVKSFYDKSSGFFDNISSEIRDRYDSRNGSAAAGGGGGGAARGAESDLGATNQGREGVPPGGMRGRGAARANRMAEERRNMATFGEAGNQYSGGGRGRGRGRGGRGRGRGGYNGSRGGAGGAGAARGGGTMV